MRLTFWTRPDLDKNTAGRARFPRPVRAVSALRLRRGHRGASSRMTSPRNRPLVLYGFAAVVVDPACCVRSSDAAGMLALRAAQRASRLLVLRTSRRFAGVPFTLRVTVSPLRDAYRTRHAGAACHAPHRAVQCTISVTTPP